MVRSRLTEVVQLVQVYARLAELEIASGERPRAGDMSLPEDVPDRVWGWEKGEERKMWERGVDGRAR